MSEMDYIEKPRTVPRSAARAPDDSRRPADQRPADATALALAGYAILASGHAIAAQPHALRKSIGGGDHYPVYS
jgi:hypothetical protein